MTKLPYTVVHYGDRDPRTTTGGVESFARGLERFFDEVVHATPRSPKAEIIALRAPIICDNQLVLDWPAHIKVIGFQHGVGAIKVRKAPSIGRLLMAYRQARAARRPNVYWVACAQWIAAEAERRYGIRSRQVIYHSPDLERFDGRREHDPGSRLVLHDARTRHKGKRLIAEVARAFPDWRFEALSCRPEEVPDRMRKARAFLHLSNYEGNSIVCNEAMAMDLPCFFTRVGLMLDAGAPSQVTTIDAEVAFGQPAALREAVGAFLGGLDQHARGPREWVMAHASPEASLERWRIVMREFHDR